MRENLSYFAYCNEKYYEAIDRMPSDKQIIKTMETACSDNYVLSEDGIFLHAKTSYELPRQGWKIHVSATYANAIQVLEIVSKVLVKNQIAFKVIRSRTIYLLTSQKAFSRVQYGKFITIYPKDQTQFLALIDLLHPLLERFDGPEILTDRRYKNSKVIHYRYGGFIPEMQYDSLGNAKFLIEDGRGEMVEDERKPYFVMPVGIENPVEQTMQTESDGSSRLFDEYNIEKAIRFTNSGGVYLATEKKTLKKVVVKEARPFTQMTKEGVDSIQLREKESELLKACQGSPFVPQLIDSFYDSGHFFLIEEYIEGQTLFSYALHHNAFLKVEQSEPVRTYIRTIIEIVSKLLDFILYLRGKGYEMRDLTLDNIMLTHSGEVKVIDMEGCRLLNSNDVITGKNSYIMDHVQEDADLCELGLLLFSCMFVNKDTLIGFNKRIIPLMLGHLNTLYSLPEELCDLISVLVYSTREARQKVPELIRRLKTGAVETITLLSQSPVKRIENTLLESIARGIINTHNKVNGSIFPYTPLLSNDLNLSCGLAGIISNLYRLGHAEFCEEFIECCRTHTSHLPAGLFVGWGGCIWTLVEIGDLSLAEELYGKHCRTPNEMNDYSLFSGLSGKIVLAAKLYLATNKASYIEDAKATAFAVIKSYEQEKNENIGLKHGNTGIALAMLILYHATHETKFLEYGKNLLDEDLKYCVEETTVIGFPAKKNGKTLYPYFMEGTCGILSVLLRYMPLCDEYRSVAYKFAKGLHYGFSVSASLFDGMAGIGNTLYDCAIYLNDEIFYRWAWEAAQFCLAHRIPFEDGTIVFPDSYCQKISVDYGYGSMGILSFLDRISKEEKTNFAIPLDELIFKNRDNG